MGAAARKLEEIEANTLSPEMIEFADHLAELLAEEFVLALKEDGHEGERR